MCCRVGGRVFGVRGAEPTTQRDARSAHPATRVAILLVDNDHDCLVAASAHRMSEPITAEGAVARPTGAEGSALCLFAKSCSRLTDEVVCRQQAEQPQAPQLLGEADPEIMAVLAKTQNKCFAEMGYFPTLLQEHHELQRQYALLRNDNQKLYADNYNLAQFIHAQDAHMKEIRAPIEQSKRTHEEMEGRLHAAYVSFSLSAVQKWLWRRV